MLLSLILLASCDDSEPYKEQMYLQNRQELEELRGKFHELSQNSRFCDTDEKLAGCNSLMAYLKANKVNLPEDGYEFCNKFEEKLKGRDMYLHPNYYYPRALEK